MKRWEGSIEIDAAPEDVWAVVIRMGQDNPDRIVKLITEGPLRKGSKLLEYIYYERTKKIHESETTVIEFVPNELFQYQRSLKNEDEGAEVTLTYALEELSGGGTELSCTSVVEGESEAIAWPPDEAFEEALESYKEKVEQN